MSANAAVVIPVYKETLNEFEKISLAQVQKVLGHYQIIFVAPQGLKISYARQGDKVSFFPPQFFQSPKTYNHLMMSAAFYKVFLNYEYILIYQLDAFVFSDKLEYFCGLGYDFIGAPWATLQKIIYDNKIYMAFVGNGGFSLRKVEKFYNLLTNHKTWTTEIKTMPEDVFFSLCGKLFPDEFRIAPIKIAYQFSVEQCVEHFVKKNGGELPFGCHAWHNCSKNFYIKEIPKFNYDISNLIKDMDVKDFTICERDLMRYSIQRLYRRIQRRQSIMRYLSRNKFASIRVIRHPFAMMIFARLMLENPTLSDEVIFYNADEKDILLQDLKLDRTPHLLITVGGVGDIALVSELVKRGFTYGSRIISFYNEYMNYCKNLFKNLGK